MAQAESAVTSDTWATLSVPMQLQAVAVADVLVHKTGAYKGSPSDALTDACGIVLAMRFAPEGDNHHNAKLCPYCNLGGAAMSTDGEGTNDGR